MDGQTGYHAGNQGSPIDDGGGSGGGGGGLVGGAANQSVFFVNEWTGRGGNAGESGAANGFAATSLSTSLTNLGNSGNGYAIVSYGGGTVAINGTVDGAHALDIVARSSDVDITGAIGGNAALTSLNITGAQGVALEGGAVTTTGAQTYTGPLTLNANTTAFTSTSNGNITFAGDIVKGSGFAGNMNVSAGSGNVSLNGQTGGSATPIGAVSIGSTGNTLLAGPVYATSFAKTGSGKTAVSGGLVRTSGSQSYAGILDLGGNTTLSSTGTGDITLGGAVSNSNQSDLTIQAAGGNVSLAGNLAVGTNARPTPIGDVSITASGTVALGSSGTPISVDAKSLSVTANAANTYADTGTSFTCGTGASATGVCLTGPATYNVAAASSFTGPLSGTASLTKSGAGKLTLTGDNAYTGNTTVSAGVLEIGGAGRLGGGTYNGNINVTGQLRFNNSAAQTLGGTMSGAGFINSPGSGVTDITTLAHADHYNLVDAYIVPTSGGSGNSSIYGNTPSFSYQVATTAAGGTAFTDADPTGTATLTGAPTVTSNVGSYTVSYTGGITINNERYIVHNGNDLSWSVTPRPLTLAASKVYDGSTLFAANAFTVTNTVNGDAAPTLGGNANVANEDAGSYTGFGSSALTQGNANYTLTGATVNVSITPRPLDIAVSKTYDGTPLFSGGYGVSGMVAGDAAPGVSGTASAPSATAGAYARFASNNLVLSDANYTLAGGAVSANISPLPPVIPAAVTTPPAIPTVTPQNPPEMTMPDYNAPLSGPASSESAGSSLQSQSLSTTQQGANAAAAPADNAPAAQNGGAPANTSGGAAPVSSVSTESGIVVSLVREPAADMSGAITVSVPKEVAGRADGFSFPLPERVAVKAGASFSIRTAEGAPPPGWLHYNPETKTFTASAVPAGGLPLHLVIRTGETESTIVISETQ
jgi:autotransporter-associated beta strand protein